MHKYNVIFVISVFLR